MGTDFDLFLWNEDTSTPFYASQTVDDSNEGFDVTLTEDGNYALYMAWPEDATGCPDIGKVEPWGAATTIW